MESDFSGYATKAGLKCSDGRTIMPGAFKHQDTTQVPLVWQHGHTDPENVLGHCILEEREDGVWAYGFFNKSPKAVHARELLEHRDINAMSIWANDIIERAKMVLHGAIREVSLVLSGANPGAKIENINIRHADDGEIEQLDEVIVYLGTIEHSDNADTGDADDKDDKDKGEDKTIQHEDDKGDKAGDEDEKTVQDVYDSMSEEQKQVLHYMIGEALESTGAVEQDNLGKDDTDTEKGKTMKHNVFEDKGKDGQEEVISHDDLKEIVATAVRHGSLKNAFEEYVVAHGITDIEVLFPDAKTISDTPEWISRRTEWVAGLLGAVRKSPFSRIKTINADLTYEEARAKGYVKGTLKKEEFFPVASRTTTPTTVYKKQALDRDDIVDITNFDVVTWLKAEMRIMLDEELARAILLGDGRDVASDDKINEGNIRPIARDHELYTTTITVNVDDANSSMHEVVDALILNRSKLKGSGLPTFFTTEYWIARFMLLRDNDNHRMYKTLAELAAELRVSNVIPVEAMMDDPTIIGILVNPADYVLGADKGGQVNMFDDFDIDYNKEKYLIETRVSGALVKIKSAMVVLATAAANVLATPVAPTFNEETGVLSITNTTGVVYKNGEVVVNAAGSPYAAIAPGASVTIDATAASGYYFANSDVDSWTFTRDAA